MSLLPEPAQFSAGAGLPARKHLALERDQRRPAATAHDRRRLRRRGISRTAISIPFRGSARRWTARSGFSRRRRRPIQPTSYLFGIARRHPRHRRLQRRRHRRRSACSSTATGSSTSTATACGTTATCGPSWASRATSRSPATGTATARPTSASSARRGRATAGPSRPSRACPTPHNRPAAATRTCRPTPPKPPTASHA